MYKVSVPLQKGAKYIPRILVCVNTNLTHHLIKHFTNVPLNGEKTGHILAKFRHSQ
jgi:hypothetical protein